MSIRPHLERNLVQAEALGEVERAGKLRKRLASLNKKPATKKPAAKKSATKPAKE